MLYTQSVGEKIHLDFIMWEFNYHWMKLHHLHKWKNEESPISLHHQLKSLHFIMKLTEYSFSVTIVTPASPLKIAQTIRFKPKSLSYP